MKVKDVFQGVAVIMICALFLSTTVGLVWDLWKGPRPEGIADIYCRQNGYAGSIDYTFESDTFFVNCTRVTIEECASNQDCMRKYSWKGMK